MDGTSTLSCMIDTSNAEFPRNAAPALSAPLLPPVFASSARPALPLVMIAKVPPCVGKERSGVSPTPWGVPAVGIVRKLAALTVVPGAAREVAS